MIPQLSCPEKNFYVNILPDVLLFEHDIEADQPEECTCTCYEDFVNSLNLSTNMSLEVLNFLKARFISLHSCCDYHKECLDQI